MANWQSPHISLKHITGFPDWPLQLIPRKHNYENLEIAFNSVEKTIVLG